MTVSRSSSVDTSCHLPSIPRICSSMTTLAISGPASSSTVATIRRPMPSKMPLLNCQAQPKSRLSVVLFFIHPPPRLLTVAHHSAVDTNRPPRSIPHESLLQQSYLIQYNDVVSMLNCRQSLSGD